jgi:hypothetical protein
MHKTLMRLVGAIAITLGLLVVPAAASAQTVPWDSVAVPPSNTDYNKPYYSSAAHPVSSITASSPVVGDAERSLLYTAKSWYETNVTTDYTNTYSIGDDESTLLSSTATSKSWDTWLIIYTIDNPSQGWRYCEFNAIVTSTRNTTGAKSRWTQSTGTLTTHACHSITTYGGYTDGPPGTTGRFVSMGYQWNSRWTSELNAFYTLTAWWENTYPALYSYHYSLDSTVKIDADSWGVTVSVWDPGTRFACQNHYTIDWTVGVTNPTITGSLIGPTCGSY